MGVPKKQIIVTGHSCGGLMTLMLFAKHPNAAGGGISFNQACFGKLSKKYKAAKVGPKAALESFKKKKPGPSVVRQSQIDEIKVPKIYLYLHLHIQKIVTKDYYLTGLMRYLV